MRAFPVIRCSSSKPHCTGELLQQLKQDSIQTQHRDSHWKTQTVLAEQPEFAQKV